MTTLWILYASVVALALCAAAAAAERGLRLADLPARGAWAGALAGAVTLPLLAHLVGPLAPLSALLGGAGSAPGAVDSVLTGAVRSAADTAGGTGSAADGASGPVGAVLESAAALDGPMVALWLALSVVLGFRLVVGWWRLRRHPDGRRERVHGRPVLVTEDDGPALAGALRPEIIVPEWFLDLPPELRELGLRHEEAHRSAGDPWLVLGAEIARVLLPWNPGVHLAAGRLRRATELDCDRRVLRAGGDRRRYGRLLIAVGERSLDSDFTGAVALNDRTSDLERRILMLGSQRRSRRPLRIACASIIAAAAVILACETPMPPVERAESTSAEISVPRDAPAAGSIRPVGDTLRPGAPGMPLLVIDGVVQEEPVEVGALDIATIDVVAADAATTIYGDRARNGLIRINTRDAAGPPETGSPSARERSQAGSRDGGPTISGISGASGPHRVILDGVVMGSDFDPDTLDPSNIERVEVRRVEDGPRAGEGVVRITTGDGG